MSEKQNQKESISFINADILRDKIYTIRGVPVMLDSDLAAYYGYTTTALNQQVKRNRDKFDEDFYFQLTQKEIPLSLISQNVILNASGNRRGQHLKKMPYAFTEQGIYMLMTVLHSKLATEQSKILIRLFKQMKDILASQPLTLTEWQYKHLNEQIQTNKTKIADIEKQMLVKNDLLKFINSFNSLPPKSELTVCAGQLIEAKLAYTQIYEQARKSIFIIDNYASLKTLLMLRNVPSQISIIIFSDNLHHSLTSEEIKSFRQEFPQLKIAFRPTHNLVHDRYLILDYKCGSQKLYHCGSSSKDAGGRLTTIMPMLGDEFFWQTIKRLLDNQEWIGFRRRHQHFSSICGPIIHHD